MPNPDGRPRKPLIERFMEKVSLDDAGCWLWQGTKNKKGYGQIGVGVANGGTVQVHRFSYENHVGAIPDGMTIDHLCRNPSCVNPEHLEPATIADNVRRGGNAVKTHCKNGHPLQGENCFRQSGGGRGCRLCRDIFNREYYGANREKLKKRRRARHEQFVCQ